MSEISELLGVNETDLIAGKVSIFYRMPTVKYYLYEKSGLWRMYSFMPADLEKLTYCGFNGSLSALVEDMCNFFGFDLSKEEFSMVVNTVLDSALEKGKDIGSSTGVTQLIDPSQFSEDLGDVLLVSDDGITYYRGYYEIDDETLVIYSMTYNDGVVGIISKSADLESGETVSEFNAKSENAEELVRAMLHHYAGEVEEKNVEFIVGKLALWQVKVEKV